MESAVARIGTHFARLARRLPARFRPGPPLVVAAGLGRADEVARLLEAGAALEDRNAQGQTALHVAARCSRAETAALLLVRGADHRALDAGGRRPLDRTNVDPETLHAIRQHYRRTPVLADEPLARAFAPVEGEPWLECLRRDGIVRIPGLVPSALLEGMRVEFEGFVRTLDERRARGEGDKRSYDEEEHWWPEDLAYVTNNAFKHSPSLTRFFHDPRLTALARSYFGRPTFITRAVAMRYLPLEERTRDMFGWHHDLEDRRLKALVLVSDLDASGQVMSYVKRSHLPRHPYRMFFRNAVDPVAFTHAHGSFEVVETTGRAGDVYLFDSNGVHRGNRRPDAPVRDTFFIEYGIETSNIWGGDPDPALVASLATAENAPLCELMAAPRKWERTTARRLPSWLENLYEIDAWRCPAEGTG